MIDKLRNVLLHPRRVLKQNLIQSFGDYETKLNAGLIARPAYGPEFSPRSAAGLWQERNVNHGDKINYILVEHR